MGRKLTRTGGKAWIVRGLGLLDKLLNGSQCRIHQAVSHDGELAYHLVPQSRGDVTRFIPENVVWACSRANYGEHYHKTLYREKHVSLFGEELILRLEMISHDVQKISMAQIKELRDLLRPVLDKTATAEDGVWILFQFKSRLRSYGFELP